MPKGLDNRRMVATPDRQRPGAGAPARRSGLVVEKLCWLAAFLF